jgi:hypothetical protein
MFACVPFGLASPQLKVCVVPGIAATFQRNVVLDVFRLTHRLNKVIPFTVVVPKLIPVLARTRLETGEALTTIVRLKVFDCPFGFVTVRETVVAAVGTLYCTVCGPTKLEETGVAPVPNVQLYVAPGKTFAEELVKVINCP